MKLFIWIEHSDYYEHIAFSLADSVEEARNILIEQRKTPSSDTDYLFHWFVRFLDKEPQVVDYKFGHYSPGGN